MIKVITPSTILPVSLEDAKTHLRVSGTSEDVLIRSLIRASTDSVENYTGRALITQTLEEVYNNVPIGERSLEFHRGPVQSISSVKYYSGDTLNTWASTNYFLDDYSIFPRMCLEYDAIWFSVDNRPNNIVIQYVAGYGNDVEDVPDAIRQAILLMIGFFYENRDDKIMRSPFKSAALPVVISYLLQPYRLWEF